MPKTKTCSKCHEIRPVGFYHKANQFKDKLFPQCIFCRKEIRHRNYLKEKDLVLSKGKSFRSANPEKYKAWQKTPRQLLLSIAKSANKRAPKFNCFEKLTPTDVYRIYSIYDRTCINCGSKGQLSVDHVIPLSKGGANAFHNLQLLCRLCNLQKAKKIVDYRMEAINAS